MFFNVGYYSSNKVVKREREEHYVKKYMSWITPILVGVIIWFMPVPEGLKPQAWHLFAIFCRYYFRIHFTATANRGLIDYQYCHFGCNQHFKNRRRLSRFCQYSYLVNRSCFLILRGFIKTGLGKRIAYTMITAVGSNSLKLSYALVVSDLI